MAINCTNALKPSSIFCAFGVPLVCILLHHASIDLHAFGIDPGDHTSYTPILTAAFLHVDQTHLYSNLTVYIPASIAVTIVEPRTGAVAHSVIYFVSSLLTWLFGDEGIHVGLSGVAIGLVSYFVAGGFFAMTFHRILMALMFFAVFGGVLGSSFVSSPGTSQDFHLSGVVAGFLLALIVNHPRVAR